jgi:hypothetical protein
MQAKLPRTVVNQSESVQLCDVHSVMVVRIWRKQGIALKSNQSRGVKGMDYTKTKEGQCLDPDPRQITYDISKALRRIAEGHHHRIVGCNNEATIIPTCFLKTKLIMYSMITMKTSQSSTEPVKQISRVSDHLFLYSVIRNTLGRKMASSQRVALSCAKGIQKT